MTLTYDHKIEILEHLADISHWETDDPVPWLMDETRRWYSNSSQGLSILWNKEQSQFIAKSDKGSFLRFEKQANAIHVYDDSGRSFIELNDNLTASDGDTQGISRLGSPKELEHRYPDYKYAMIEPIGVLVVFEPNGTTHAIFAGTGHKITVDHSEYEHQAIQSGAFFHRIAFTEAAWGSIPLYTAMNNVKLVLAVDLGIEPDILAQNTLDFDAGHELVDEILKDPDKHSDKTGLLKELPWSDTTEFTGHLIACARNVSFVKTDSGFEVQADLDRREWILSQATVTTKAACNHSLPVTRMNKRWVENDLFDFLSQGAIVKDHRNTEWRIAKIRSPHASKLARQIRRDIDNQGLSGYFYAAVNYNRSHVLLSAQSDIAHQAILERSASIELLDLITTEQCTPKRMLELLEQGANYKYVDTARASRGYTFANLLMEMEQFESLAAMRDTIGTHDLSFQIPEV